MHGFKSALRRRLDQGPLAPETLAALTAALETATRTLETSMSDTNPSQQDAGAPVDPTVLHPAPADLTLTAVADIATPAASKYLQQLCKHFQHKRPVAFDPQHGEIGFSTGICRLDAGDETLTLTLSARDDADMEHLKDVVVRHLVRFAFREEMTVTWRD